MQIKKLVMLSGLALLAACSTTDDKNLSAKEASGPKIVFQTNIHSIPTIEVGNECIPYIIIKDNIMAGFTPRYFEINKAAAINVPEQQNECVAQLLQHYPLKLELQGFTDNSGSKQYNKKLAQRRAQSVKEELLTYGIQKQSIIIADSGKVITTKKTDSLSRRVNLTIK
ncbi:OmpA family protein [Psychromonas aquimarina]|uniref:OmpA family protein n=1 Tax=Psychromonas aquimarina TaxID=444919 RepID=UPI0003F714A6|nr:OmpA family protein [Psychromonas aquimarina]